MAATPRTSRNANPLAEAFTMFVAMDPAWFCARWGGNRSCETRDSDPHCPVCHLPAHVCQECGGEIDRYGSSAVTARSDRTYCSDACRQRAYRRRGKSKGA